MEDDEDEAMKLLQMKIQLAEMTANKKKKTVQTAAASEVQHAPCVEAVQTAWQSVRSAAEDKIARDVRDKIARDVQDKRARDV